MAAFASRFTGSSDLYESDGRHPSASINFITAHDGFTLADLVSYNEKHNEANLEDNRDGTDDNRSWNCGVEGPTDDPEVIALRERQQRNFLATLLLSQGVPMLLAGDEMGRTQRGNNNAWCQDNEISWVDWELDEAERGAARVHAPPAGAAPRAPDLPSHAVPQRRGLGLGAPRRLVVPARRPAHDRRRLAERRRARARRVPQRPRDRERRAEGEPIVDSSFLLLLNAHHEDITFTLPPRRFGPRWQVELSTAHPRAPATLLTARGSAHVTARSLLLLRQPDAPASELTFGQSCTVAPETPEEELVAEKTVVLVGTLDTKGREYAFLRDRLQAAGVATILVDAGIMGAAAGRARRAPRGGRRRRGRRRRGAARRRRPRPGRADDGARRDGRGRARCYAEGRCDGVLAAGGSGNTSIAAEAMRALPVGVPKLIVSTIAAGDTRPIVGASDMLLAASVVDVAGINSVSARILANAAAAMAGMVQAAPLELGESRPLIAASMFGVTTPCVTHAAEMLDGLGYEVLTFHMTGTGGRSMEALIAGGFIAGVLDATTTELCDELVGGVLSAGPDRLTAAGRAGVPQVVSLGALDMVNFGPRETVPAQFEGRNLYVHNAQVTLMRTTPEECAQLGEEVARKLSAATGPVALFVPLGGISMIATPGGPFYDADGRRGAVRGRARELPVRTWSSIELDTDINDPAFADAMVAKLHGFVGGAA